MHGRLTVLLLLLGSVFGCDDTFVDPFENEDRYFTVFGYLDVLEINQVIRVIPITRRSAVIVSPTQPEAFIDAEVFAYDLDNDLTHEWNHSLDRLEDGTYGHIFRSTFVVQPGATYRLEIVRSDGITATALTTVPHIADSTFFNLSQVRFLEDSTRLTQDIFMPDLNAPWSIEALYRWNDGRVARRVNVPYGRQGNNESADGWNFTVQISEDQQFVRNHIRQIGVEGILLDDAVIILESMGLQIRIIDPNWDLPIDIFDPQSYANPDKLTNVENGYGFFGALGFYIQEWNACDLSGPLGYEPAEPECSVKQSPESRSPEVRKSGSREVLY